MAEPRHQLESQLIAAVREKKCIWDMSKVSYKDVSRKAAAWNSVAEQMEKTATDVKKIWTNLRSAYMRIKREKKKRLISGSAAASDDDDEEKLWIHYKALSFLDPIVEERKERSTNLDEERPRGYPVPTQHEDSFYGLERTAEEDYAASLDTPSSSGFQPHLASTPNPSPSSPSPPKKKKRVDDETLRDLITTTLSAPTPVKTPVTAFAAFIEQMLSQMPEAERKAKMEEMTKVLFK
jgi:hypothetical protein